MTVQPDQRELDFNVDLAWRIKFAVESIGRPKKDVAQSIGVSQQRLSNWMTNQNRPDWFGIAKLCKRYGISPAWVLLGEVAGLPHEMADRLERAVAERSSARAAQEHPDDGKS